MDGLIYEQEVICPYYANYASQLLDIPSIAFDGSISPASYAICRMCVRVVLQVTRAIIALRFEAVGNVYQMCLDRQAIVLPLLRSHYGFSLVTGTV